MKVRCPLCGQLIVRKKLVVVHGVYHNDKVMRVCVKCNGLPETVHKKLFEKEMVESK